MADEGNIFTDLDLDPSGQGGEGYANGADNQPAAGLISQYVKDLSVENPNAPRSYQWQGTPQVDVQFNIMANAVEGEVHEVELRINATSKTDEGNVYLVELHYAGLVGMRNLPDEQMHAFLYAEAPRLLFPFARRVIADATRDAGFAPLLLDPIDFGGLYMQQLQQRQAGQAGAGDASVN